jgi:hypothetical protein
LTFPIIPVLGEDEKGPELRGILPHEPRGVQVQGDVCFIATASERGGDMRCLCNLIENKTLSSSSACVTDTKEEQPL